MASVAVALDEVEVPHSLVVVKFWVVELLANDALGIIDPSWLSPGTLANDDLTRVAKADPGRGGVFTQVVCNDLYAI